MFIGENKNSQNFRSCTLVVGWVVPVRPRCVEKFIRGCKRLWYFMVQEILWDTHLRYFAIIWYHLRYKSWHPVNRTRDHQSNPWNICATFRNTLVDRNQQASFWASQCMLFCFHLCCISLHFCAPFFKKNLFFQFFQFALDQTCNDNQWHTTKCHQVFVA